MSYLSTNESFSQLQGQSEASKLDLSCISNSQMIQNQRFSQEESCQDYEIIEILKELDQQSSQSSKELDQQISERPSLGEYPSMPDADDVQNIKNDAWKHLNQPRSGHQKEILPSESEQQFSSQYNENLENQKQRERIYGTQVNEHNRN